MKRIIKHFKENWYKYGLEILVVVFGVLIAFSLGNWNEGIKTNKKLNRYTENLINDIVSDTMNISNIIHNKKQMQHGIELY